MQTCDWRDNTLLLESSAVLLVNSWYLLSKCSSPKWLIVVIEIKLIYMSVVKNYNFFNFDSGLVVFGQTL